MPVCVIDLLKIINIDHKNRHGFSDNIKHILVQGPAVSKPCESVVACGILQQLVALFQANRLFGTADL